MNVALITDWMSNVGGGGRVLSHLHAMFPEAPIYTTILDPSTLSPAMREWDVRTSFLQRIPFARRHYQAFLPLMPLAFEQFDLRAYDLVISASSACAKGVITSPDTCHVCYCYTPCRYLWDLYPDYTQYSRARPLMAAAAHWLRQWDRVSADRVDHFVAISQEVAGRIRKHYRRQTEVVYPPVDTERVLPNGAPPEDFYLVVSRLVPYKRVDLAVAAATRMRRRLIVVGRGPELKRLRSIAGPTVEFAGWRSDEEVGELMARCRALLFPGHEDFGITPVEAQAAGRPVIAYARGGATETVADGATGVHFEQQSEDALIEAIRRFERQSWSAQQCRDNALRFSATEFRERMGHVIERALSERFRPAPRAAARLVP
jgi:glycosyltransferase involved in cell wall biosynthesis